MDKLVGLDNAGPGPDTDWWDSTGLKTEGHKDKRVSRSLSCSNSCDWMF